MNSLIIFPLNPPFSGHRHHHNRYDLRPFRSTSLSHFFPKKSHVQASFSSSSPDYDREEARWLREEKRWLREEQRWLREEQRWAKERESLLREIDDLKLEIQALEKRQGLVQGGGSEVDVTASITGLLEVLNEKNLIAESGTSATPIVLEEEVKKEVVVEEVVRVSKEEEKKDSKKWRTLRIGAEGDEVQAMQEALLKLGFYSGEEDMEYSSFSSGTERAVRTWQASVGAPEDGVMSTELLERLYVEQLIGTADSNIYADKKEVANGAVVASVTKISEIQEKIVKDVKEIDASEHRVFLLGENRWEDPSRLVGRNKHVNESRSSIAKTKCLTCRGEGRLMCLECDGTGEPNLEPQFLEWVDEGAKCPYCEGLGYTTCDVCQGKTLI